MEREQLVAALTDPLHRTTEANIQSAVRDLLVHGDLDLVADQIVNLEAPAGTGRIDVEVGSTVIEVKKSVEASTAEAHALPQLCGYVRTRQDERGGRYVGVLTDGINWSAWHLPEEAEELEEVDRFQLRRDGPDTSLDGLLVWLDGLLATKQHLPPTPAEVELRLGSASTASKLDLASLEALHRRAASDPAVQLKQELWTKLLKVASGTAVEETDDLRLFLEHTYLVVLAETIAHAVLGYDVSDLDPDDMLRGRLFVGAGVYGVIEQDFFDWVGDVEGGLEWVRSLASRVGRFHWQNVDHDVLKVLYESVIDPETRHQLGEHYTPDWLAKAVVEHAIDDPATQRVLDPACGSGTFVFWALRRCLEALEQEGLSNAEVLDNVTSRVYGMDVHPVAVTLARVTYLLALGTTRLTSSRNPVSVPVYLGDAVQFEQRDDMWQSDGLVLHASDGYELVPRELQFPDRVVDDVGNFDQLIVELTSRACDRAPGSAVPDIGPVLNRFGIHPEDRPTLVATFLTLCQLNDDGRNHIWGYYLRNLARPRWLARAQNRVDRIVGNPPWLSFRFMPPDMKEQFRKLAVARGLWTGGQVATQQDLSALFVARSCELYLAVGGRFSMVVPYATLSRQAYEGFRSGKWAPDNMALSDSAFTSARFDRAWDLHEIRPDIFPVPSAVVHGERLGDFSWGPLPTTMERWSGRQPQDLSVEGIVREIVPLVTVPGADADWSPYHARFTQGATITPRVLKVVEEVDAGPLGVPGDQVAVQSMASLHEPWRSVPPLSGQVEQAFFRAFHLGATVMPFRLEEPQHAVVPWDAGAQQLLRPTDSSVANWPGLADWYARTEAVWQEHRSQSSPATLGDRLDYQRGITNQIPVLGQLRVVYSTSGSTLTAAIVPQSEVLIDSSLYWCAASSISEARYLVALLNAPETTRLVQPLQSIGAFGPRHFHKWVWALPIPHFDPQDETHKLLVDLAVRCEEVVAATDVSEIRYPGNRTALRQRLVSAGLMDELNAAVETLTTQAAQVG